MDKLESEREKWEEGLRANLAEQKNKMEAELREKMERELKEIEEDMEAMRDRRMLELQVRPGRGMSCREGRESYVGRGMT